MKKLICILFCLVIGSAWSQEQLTRILFILDASNSMNATWDGNTTRIQAAKALLSKTIDSISNVPNLEIALRVYGHQSPITATYQDCNDTKLEVPFGKNNTQAIKNKIKTIDAKGTTPIARSLEAAAADFPDAKSRNVIILITDGLEACDNDPCVIAKKLRDKAINITPFVIGLGLDLSYLEQFRCIGSFVEAETSEALKVVLNQVVNKVLLNTTVQINLNNTAKKPLETDVTIFAYKSGTKELKYTFFHTMNRFGNPDTLIMDPAIKYDLVVNTIPQIELSAVSIQKNTHNTIQIDAPQGNLKLRFTNASKSYNLQMRVFQTNNTTTLNVQEVNGSDKYIVGKYKVEVLCLPRIYQDVTITQSGMTYVDVPAPGQIYYAASTPFYGQLFIERENGVSEWVCNLDHNLMSGNLALQPGAYKIVYRQKDKQSTSYTFERTFRIQSNNITNLRL